MADVDGKVADGRALRRMETHEQLFQASVRVITARGYDGTTMDEIAAEAGVSRRTAFNHFPAKSDIADEWAARRGERALEAIGRAGSPARSGPDRVRVYFHELALMTERDWEETRQMTAGWLAWPRYAGSSQHAAAGALHVAGRVVGRPAGRIGPARGLRSEVGHRGSLRCLPRCASSPAFLARPPRRTFRRRGGCSRSPCADRPRLSAGMCEVMASRP